MITNQYGVWQPRGDICSVDDCEKRVKALNMCSRHYEQTRLHGETHDRPKGVRATPACDRILRRVDKSTGCWVYEGAPNTKRPTVSVDPGRVLTIYHAVYEVLVGSVPEGQMLHHTCENPRCVNPEHLELMTRADHTRLHKPRLGTGQRR